MRCQKVQQNLDLFVRQELAPDVQKSIKVHLSGCERCHGELARLRKLEELLASASSPPVPDGFARLVTERARREAVPDYTIAPRRAGQQLGRNLRIAASTAAALACGLFLGGYLGIQTWAPPSAAQQADPLGGSGLGQFVEPGGDSLAQAYLAMTAGDDG